MSRSVCTAITSGGLSPLNSFVLYKTTTSVDGKVVCNTVETISVDGVKDDFMIISDISDIIEVSGGGQSTMFLRDRLDVALPGTLLLIERDGDWGRVLKWFYCYGLSLQQYNQIRIVLDAPDVYTGGIQYWFDGMDGKFWVHETVLERKWSGRLYIQQYRRKPLMFLKYVWRDMVSWFGNWSSRGSRHESSEV